MRGNGSWHFRVNFKWWVWLLYEFFLKSTWPSSFSKGESVAVSLLLSIIGTPKGFSVLGFFLYFLFPFSPHFCVVFLVLFTLIYHSSVILCFIFHSLGLYNPNFYLACILLPLFYPQSLSLLSIFTYPGNVIIHNSLRQVLGTSSTLHGNMVLEKVGTAHACSDK